MIMPWCHASETTQARQIALSLSFLLKWRCYTDLTHFSCSAPLTHTQTLQTFLEVHR